MPEITSERRPVPDSAATGMDESSRTTPTGAARSGDPRDRRTAVAAMIGGALTGIGAVLPWLSLFAGLQSYSGMTGLYGRLLFAGGVVAIVGGLAALVRPSRWLRAAIGALGILLVLFASWLVLGLRSATRALAAHPLLIARPGPGLVVALAGALVVAATLLPELGPLAPTGRGADGAA
ncbi:MAG: hypothetical protein ACJ79S_13940 [Gemmatimonadaceae bacterium]